jgi:DNA repair ATPase RecN
MEVVNVIEELRKEAQGYRRADAKLTKHRERIAELLRIARAEGKKPADLARLLDHLYTPDHISRIAPPPEKD